MLYVILFCGAHAARRRRASPRRQRACSQCPSPGVASSAGPRGRRSSPRCVRVRRIPLRATIGCGRPAALSKGAHHVNTPPVPVLVLVMAFPRLQAIMELFCASGNASAAFLVCRVCAQSGPSEPAAALASSRHAKPGRPPRARPRPGAGAHPGGGLPLPGQHPGQRGLQGPADAHPGRRPGQARQHRGHPAAPLVRAPPASACTFNLLLG
jgi:hypothetical protein